jgi:hypothetical protein
MDTLRKSNELCVGDFMYEICRQWHVCRQWHYPPGLFSIYKGGPRVVPLVNCHGSYLLLIVWRTVWTPNTKYQIPNTTMDNLMNTTVGKIKRDTQTKKQRMTRKRTYPLVKTICRIPYQHYVKEMARINRDTGGKPKSMTEYGAQWRGVVDKSKWEDLAAYDVKCFIEEAHAHGYTYIDKKKRKTGVKRPVSAFVLYARDHVKRLQNEYGVKYVDALIILGKYWRETIDPLVKSEYTAKAEADRVQCDGRVEDDIINN